MNTSNKSQTNDMNAQSNATRIQSGDVKAQTIDPAQLVVDCTPVGPFLVDLPVGARQGMMSEQRGLPEVIAEILANQGTLGARAGVTEHEIDDLTSINERIAMIDEHLIPADKLVELLRESRAKLDNDRHRLISAIASMVETRAKLHEDELILARYEKTRTYRSARALKAAKTRRRKAAPADVMATSDMGSASA